MRVYNALQTRTSQNSSLMLNEHSLKSIAVLWLIAFLATGSSFGQGDKPNILIIYGDDATYNLFPLYGGQSIETPNIDRLAQQGLTFNYAFQAMSMCAPSRAELYTGLYPVRNGVVWNHANARPGIKSIVHHLSDLGYRVNITGKVHAGPEEVFPFERLDILNKGTIDQKKLRNYAKDSQPFCLIVASGQPHSPWNMGHPEKFDPDTLTLPPNLVDTEVFRKLYAKYLAEMEHLDWQVGQCLEVLEQTGQADNTLVIFTSEHGAPFPGAKWTNWNVGVHTAFVVRWPGVVAPGSRTDALIQYADVLPTLVAAAGGTVDTSQFDGTSFLPVLKGETDEHRQYAYFMHNHVPEGPPYPTRSVTDGQHHYIRNLKPDNLVIEKHVFGNVRADEVYMPSWFYKTTTDEHAQKLVFRFMHRPAEELYLIQQDPYEFENLAQDSKLKKIKQQLSHELEAWMQRQNDPGAALDSWKVYKAHGGYLDE